MDADDVPSSPGFRSLETTCSSPPPHASQAPISSALGVPAKSGRHMEEPNDVPSSPGLEATRPSPPPQASHTPIFSAPDPPPPRPSTPLGVAEPSASSSREGLKLQVNLVTRECFESVEVTFQPSQTVQDIKDYFEKLKGNMCSAENMVIYHDGTKLSSMTSLATLDLETWSDILITDQVDSSVPISAMVDEDLMLPIEYFSSEITNEDFELLRCEYDVLPSTQDAVEPVVNLDCTTSPDYDYPSMLGQSDIAVTSTSIGEIPIGTAETAITTPVETAFHTDETALTMTAETALTMTAETALTVTAETAPTSVEIALPTAETSPAVAEILENLVPSSCSHVLIGRLLIPVTPADFLDRLLSENQLHGFQTVNELINEINRGPPRWITKKQALGLLYNAEMFSVTDVKDDAKKDGLSCVINSTKCQVSSTLSGYSATANFQSSENLIGKMKEKGVEMDWFEIRGKLWSRRRLVLKGGDGVFHLLQWKQHHNRETEAAAARASTSDDQTTQELRQMISNAATEARTPGERTQVLGEEITTQEVRHTISDAATGASTPGERMTQVLGGETSVGAREGGLEEMRVLIQEFQTAVCAQFKEFQTTVSTQLSQFDSHIQRIETRVEVIEKQRSTTVTLGPTL